MSHWDQPTLPGQGPLVEEEEAEPAAVAAPVAPADDEAAVEVAEASCRTASLAVQAS